MQKKSFALTEPYISGRTCIFFSTHSGGKRPPSRFKAALSIRNNKYRDFSKTTGQTMGVADLLRTSAPTYQTVRCLLRRLCWK